MGEEKTGDLDYMVLDVRGKSWDIESRFLFGEREESCSEISLPDIGVNFVKQEDEQCIVAELFQIVFVRGDVRVRVGVVDAHVDKYGLQRSEVRSSMLL